jgi:hypothetical protein
METPKIEQGIAIPFAGKRKYPFPSMNVGDSFFVEADFKTQASIRSNSSFYGKRHGVKMVARVEGNGIRVWRIA